MPPIQVVLFDLGGTLLHYEHPPERTLEAVNAAAVQALLAAATRAGARVADADVAVRAVQRMAAASEARATRANYANRADDIIREGLEAVGVRLGQKAWTAGLEAYYNAVSQFVEPVEDDVAAVLDRLVEQGRSLGLVSNTIWAPEVHDADLARFGLLEYLPVRVYSYSAGIVKPHTAIYRQALDRLDVAPPEAVFVGDRLSVDVAGPQKIGMRAILLASPFRVEEDPEIQPDARIRTLAELPDLLEAWDRAIEERMPSG